MNQPTNLIEEEYGLDPQALLMEPALWASIMFGHEVPDFHAWLWRYLTSDIRYLTALLPGGTGKSHVVSMEYPLWSMCVYPNVKIGLIQKGIEQGKRQMEAIQRQLTHNSILKKLYGPFKPDGETEGYPWSTTTLRLKTNTATQEKTNTLHAFGVSSTDVLGYRFDTLIIDDVCTDQNSYTPEARAKLETKLTTEWDKTLIGSQSPRLRMVGTAFAFEDLYLSKANSKNPSVSDFIGPNDWREPDEIDSSGYVTILKDAEIGMCNNPLWVKQLPWEYLEFEKSKSVLNYNRRLRNIVQDPDTAIFLESAIRGEDDFPGCLDHDRIMGYRDPIWRVICGVDPSSGKDTGAAAQFAHVTVGTDPQNTDRINLIDLFTGPVPMSRREDYDDPPDEKSQVGTIIHRHHKYAAAFTVIETNAQQHAWVTTTRSADPHITLRPHYTGRKKIDKTVGVESMAGIIEQGLLRIPYGDRKSRILADVLIEQLVRYPNYSYSDLVMALWFCYINVRKRTKIQVFDYNKLRQMAKPLGAARKL